MLVKEECTPEIKYVNFYENIFYSDFYDYYQKLSLHFSDFLIIEDRYDNTWVNSYYDKKYNFIGNNYTISYFDELSYNNLFRSGHTFYNVYTNFLLYNENYYTYYYVPDYQFIKNNIYSDIDIAYFYDTFEISYNGNYVLFDTLKYNQELRNKLETSLGITDNFYVQDVLVRDIIVYKYVIDYFQQIILLDTYTYFDNKPKKFNIELKTKITENNLKSVYIQNIKDLDIIFNVPYNSKLNAYGHDLKFYSNYPNYIDYRDLFTDSFIIGVNNSFAEINNTDMVFRINKDFVNYSYFNIAKVYNSSDKHPILKFNINNPNDNIDVFLYILRDEISDYYSVLKLNNLDNNIIINYPIKNIFLDCLIYFRLKPNIINNITIENNNINSYDNFNLNEYYESYIPVLYDFVLVSYDKLSIKDTLYNSKFSSNTLNCLDTFIFKDYTPYDFSFNMLNINSNIVTFEKLFSDEYYLITNNISAFGEFYNVYLSNFEVVYA